jgi:hypothetical protein
LLGKLKNNHFGLTGAKAPAAPKLDEDKEEMPKRKKNFLEMKRLVNYEQNAESD